MVSITKQISEYNFSSREGSDVEYIVVHDVGVKGQTAKGNADYFGEGDKESSAHFFVDDTSIYQVVEKKNSAWHVGDGDGEYGITNSNSIGVELIVDSEGTIKEKTLSNAMGLIKDLQEEYDVSFEKVVRHYDASRKNCPQYLNKDGDWKGWKKFKDDLKDSDSDSNQEYPSREGFDEDQIENVKTITEYFKDKGWTIEAIAGVLGNMEQESTIRPDISETDGERGYGLVQWTDGDDESVKGVDYIQELLEAADIKGDYRDINTQLDLLDWHMHEEGDYKQYIETSDYPYTVEEFTKLEDAAEAAMAFLRNFERAEEDHPERQEMAKGWYDYLTDNVDDDGGDSPEPDPDPDPEPTEDNLEAVQKWLNKTYSTKLETDNDYGPLTQEAIVTGVQTELNEQFDAGLDIDGVYGPATQEAFVTIRSGSEGNFTRLIQGQLIALDYEPNGFDGIYGSGLLSAIEQFQSDKGLDVDGVVGPDTANALFNNYDDENETGNLMEEIQQFLNDTYNLNLEVDGAYGPSTQEAIVMGVQTELNEQYGADLTVDGIFGSGSQEAFVSIKPNSEGNITRLIQAQLIGLGYETNGFDGIYGSGLEKAVRNFQSANGLSADGVVGKDTAEQLFNA